VLQALSAIERGHVFRFKLLNIAFITLLSKKADAMQVKDYKPVSLVYNFMKLVTKILANRLAPLFTSLISTNQSAFVTKEYS
jgi:hypothetical protein